MSHSVPAEGTSGFAESVTKHRIFTNREAQGPACHNGDKENLRESSRNDKEWPSRFGLFLGISEFGIHLQHESPLLPVFEIRGTLRTTSS